MSIRPRSWQTMTDDGQPDRRVMRGTNGLFCRFHGFQFMQTHGSLLESDVNYQSVLSELLALPHFLASVEKIQANRRISRRMAIREALSRLNEHMKLAGCCLVGDDKMREIYHRSWNRAGLPLRKIAHAEDI